MFKIALQDFVQLVSSRQCHPTVKIAQRHCQRQNERASMSRFLVKLDGFRTLVGRRHLVLIGWLVRRSRCESPVLVETRGRGG